MRTVLVMLVVVGAGCSCKETKAPAPMEVAVTPAPPPTVAAAAPRVTAMWVQQRLQPTSAELGARIEYGPSTTELEVQLELPPGVRVTRGRTYFKLPVSAETKVHYEPIALESDALPVKDLVLLVRGPGVALRESYRFGRPPPR